MSAQYQKLYANGNVVAYVRVGSVQDHLFIWDATDAPATPCDLETLLTSWSKAATGGGGLRRRTLFFCQSFPTNIKPLLDIFLFGGTNFYGMVCYWKDAVFVAGPDFTTFPSKNSQVAQVANMSLYSASSETPASLDDFTISAESTGDTLHLILTKDPTALWQIDGVTGTTINVSPATATNGISMDLAGGASPSGGIGLSLPWPADGASLHPLQRMGFIYAANPESGPPQDPGIPEPCRVWQPRFCETVVSIPGTASRCTVYLDPRDNLGLTPWIPDSGKKKASGFASRLHFDDNALVNSHFYSPSGQRYILQALPQDNAIGRLGPVFNNIDSDGTLSPDNNVMFHPEGAFALPSSPPAAAAATTAPPDLMTGAASTEFVDVSKVTHFSFSPGPAFFSYQTPDLLNSLQTSHISLVSSAMTAPDYHTQPSEAPLFDHMQPLEAPLFDTDKPTYLARRRKEYGNASNPLPFLPFAGLSSDSSTPDGQQIHTFDSTHLSLYRRTHVTRTPPPALALAAAAAPATTMAITPQGVLASVSDNGYNTLYFGSAEATASADFSIQIKSGSPLYDQIQLALASNQLFMVFRNPSADNLKTIQPSAQITSHGFTFSIGINLPPDTPSATPGMSASALLVKFYKGKSLKDLIANPSLWVCQTALAPDGNKPTGSPAQTPWGDIATTTNPDPAIQQLKAIWNDANWQGILALDFPVADMPDILEALRPGLSIPPGQKLPELRAHHLGLNALPVKKDSLDSPSPQRPGSAFGLINYSNDGSKAVTLPNPVDKPPVATPEDTFYSFFVNELYVAFANSQISAFSATVTLGFQHLFWDAVATDATTPAGATKPAKGLVLKGTYEKRPQPNGQPKDVFSLATESPLTVTFPGSMIDQVVVSHAQLSVTSASSAGTDPSIKKIEAFIDFDATLSMKEALTLAFFRVSAIRLSSFGFGFTYDHGIEPAQFDFRFQTGGISADIDFDPSGLPSLLSLLPVKLKGMTLAIDKLLDIETDLHFKSISFGTNLSTKLNFGFLMEIDFGSMGLLSGSQSSLRFPLLLGWSSGGSGRGICFGIQFPAFNGKINIGIQQFIELQAEGAALSPCFDGANLSAIAIQLEQARIVMFGKEWPGGDLGIYIKIPIGSGRKPSWAFALQEDTWSVGGGYRIGIAGSSALTTEDLIDKYFESFENLNDVCGKFPTPHPELDNWSVIGQYEGEASFGIGIAVSDPSVYGVYLSVSDFTFDLLYRRVNDQLGIFSAELALPESLRTMQFGAATVRLPVIRGEIHTDGGYLFDFGFPWNNDFSRSAQVEVYIFLGSGGFYYGDTSYAAVTQFDFAGGYGYPALTAADSGISIRTLRIGYASRGGVGRSFTFGILNAEASLTLFGSLEGASGYESAKGTSLFNPLVYYLGGTMGLMLDISFKVSFPLIQASAHLLAYADLGIVIRRVIVKDTAGNYVLLTLPLVVYTEVGLSISVDVSIKVGCVHITITLRFSTTWRLQFTFGDIKAEPYNKTMALAGAPHGLSLAALAAARAFMPPIAWSSTWKYWNTPQPLTIFATILPCMSGSGAAGSETSVVGTMLLSMENDASGFCDFARFLAAWALLQNSTLSGNPSDYDAISVDLASVIGIQNWLSPGPDPVAPDPAHPAAPPPDPDAIWLDFPKALLDIVSSQFNVTLKPVPPNPDPSTAGPPYAVIPPWPKSQFSYMAPTGWVIVAQPQVNELGTSMAAGDAAFVEYCRHVLVGTVLEIRHIIEAGTAATPPVAAPAMTWGDIWKQMFSSSK